MKLYLCVFINAHWFYVMLLSYANTIIYFSHFFTQFFIGLLCRIWLCANLHILVIWSFLVRVDCAFGW